MSLKIGQPLYGYCAGYLDDLGYSDNKRIEALGFDWAVVRDSDGKLAFIGSKNHLDYLEKNCTEPEKN